MRRCVGLLLFVVLLCACDGGETLLVDVLTDLRQGRDFVSVRTELLPRGGGVAEREASRVVSATSGLAAFRVAEWDDVPSGLRLVRATLIDQDGAELTSGQVLVDLSGGGRIVTVVITRNCVDVSCDGEAVCVDGQCVDPTCSPENLEACPNTCESDAACAATGPECVVGRCAEGICFELADDTQCGGGVCQPEFGCVGGPPDAGPEDAGPPDAGPPDAGPPDAGPPPMLQGVFELGLGDRHTCARIPGGTRCWGANESGQHGNGTTLATSRPGAAVVGAGGGFTSGADHVCSAAVSCWGLNADGQLGQASPASSPMPLTVSAGGRIGGPVATGRAHTCAPVNDLCVSPGPCDHDVWCWGSNSQGQLGDGSRVSRTSPVLVDTEWAVVSSAAGDEHTCMVSNEGFGTELFCWGANAQGQLGDGSTQRRLTPTLVTLDGSALQVVAGARHSCARVGTTVYCFGDNRSGQVDSAAPDTVSTPRLIDVGGSAQSIAAGGEHTCAVVDGVVRCWGQNTDGQLGDGTTSTPAAPVEAVGITTAVAVYAGLAHTCARLDDDTVRCWGRNTDGQLGDGTLDSSPLPVAVLPPE